MTETERAREIMVRPWHFVPAGPHRAVKSVYGQRTEDPHVETAVVVFRYWATEGIPASLTLKEFLKIADRGLLHSGNIRDFFGLLSRYGLIEKFFNLTRSTIDTQGRLRSFLLRNDVSIDDIRHYGNWSGIHPKDFLDGFVIGMTESAATIVTDLRAMGEILVNLYQAQFRAIAGVVANPVTGFHDLLNQVATVLRLFEDVLTYIDPRELPDSLAQRWSAWNGQFEQHLESLDAFAAGHQLGRIAGDLWQLLGGAKALSQLTRVTTRAALNYPALLVGSFRRIWAEREFVIQQLAKVLILIGRETLARMHIVGIGVLKILFPQDLMRKMFRDGRAFLIKETTSLFPVFDEAHHVAFAGSPLRSSFAIVVAESGQPRMMASLSDRLPTTHLSEHADLATALDEIVARLDELFAEPGRRAGQLNLTEATTRAAAVALLTQRLDVHLRNLVQMLAYQCFFELKKTKKKVFANELGSLIHRRVATLVPAEIMQAAPGAWFRAESSVSTITREVLAGDSTTSALAVRRAETAINQTVAKMISERDDVMDILAVERTVASRTERGIARMLKEFGWNEGTLVGSLRSDLTVADLEAKRLINVDFTSSTKADRFEGVWARVSSDLGAAFNGDWTRLPEAYQRLGKELPDEVVAGISALTTHAVRETVIRRAALESVLGPLWNISSHEMLYDGLRKLYASVK